MAKRRNWTQYPARVSQQLNGVSGVAGVGGAAVGVAGLSLVTGVLSTVLVTGGLGITMVSLLYAIFKAVPPKFREPQELVGTSVNIDELARISPPVAAIAIIGPSQAGKTTLKYAFSHQPSSSARTQATSAYIATLQTPPSIQVAFLDGGGEKYPQQFKIAELADLLIVLLDHNSSDTDVVVDPQRLGVHQSFLTQVRHHLDHVNASPKKCILVLKNKADLWSAALPNEVRAFDVFCEQEADKWRAGNRANSVVIRSHSNQRVNDIAALMAEIRRVL
jgi:GTPase SAR1 family protein